MPLGLPFRTWPVKSSSVPENSYRSGYREFAVLETVWHVLQMDMNVAGSDPRQSFGGGGSPGGAAVDVLVGAGGGEFGSVVPGGFGPPSGPVPLPVGEGEGPEAPGSPPEQAWRAERATVSTPAMPKTASVRGA